MDTDYKIINLSIAEKEPKRYRNKTVKVPIYLCPECGVECQYIRGLRVHVSLKHPNIGFVLGVTDEGATR